MLTALFVFAFANTSLAQGPTCAEATQLCDDPACGGFEIGSGQGQDPIAGESSSCVGGDPNATWFFLIDDQGGGGTINISNTPACDTDFVAWGPFDSPADALAACAGGISPANEVGCDFTTAPGGTINIPAASQVGDVYLMVVTNFSDDPGITVNVTTANPLECCPVGTGVKADEEICSGGTSTAAITDFEGTAGEITGATQFLADLGLSTSPTALVAPTAADFTNTTCAATTLTLYYLFSCDANCDAVADDPSVAGSYTVTIYPDATTWVVTETPGACGTAATVDISTAGGMSCFSDAGAAPADLGCGNTDNQDLAYNFDPGFAAACNMMFFGTVAAECEGTGCGCADPCFVEYDPAVPAPGDPALCVTLVSAMTPCDDGDPCTINDMEVLGGDGSVCEACVGTPITPPVPTLTCPPANLNLCDGTFDCMFSDSNGATAGNGTTDAPIIGGTAAFATDATGVIDLTQLTDGVTYTLTLNYEEAGCFGTMVTCTFTAEVPNDAEGGAF